VLLSGAFGAGLVVTVAGYAAPVPTSVPCMPPAYTLDSPVSAPGGTLGISAPGATCNPGYGKDAVVRIELVENRQQDVLTELAPMSDAGAFTYDLRLPGGTKPGAYGITARASCAAPRIGFQVTT
jgi:hypothetical protein